MMVIGQVPLGVPSLEVTTRPGSPQASVMVKPALRKYDSVRVAAGRSDWVHPSTAIVARVPVILGAVLSLMVMVWGAVEWLPQASVTV